MTEIKPHYAAKKMSLDDAIKATMTQEGWDAYLELHEVTVTRRDD